MAIRLGRRRTLAALVGTAVVGLLVASANPVAAKPPPGGDAAAPASAEYRVLGPKTLADRNAVAGTGASIDYVEHGVLNVTATGAEAGAIQRLGFTLEKAALPPAVSGGPTAQAFPPADSAYHDYA